MVLGWGKKQELPADTEEEMSMEEILASIRKYVSTDQQSSHQETSPSTESAPQHRVVVEEEVSPYRLEPQTNRVDAAMSLKTSSLSPESYQEVPPQNYQESNRMTWEQEEVMAASAVEHAVTTKMADKIMNSSPSKEEGLLSSGTVDGASQAFSKLMEISRMNSEKTTAPTQSAQSLTLDQLITDLARPMIKSWVDQNLTQLVEKMVATEIEKITRKFK